MSPRLVFLMFCHETAGIEQQYSASHCIYLFIYFIFVCLAVYPFISDISYPLRDGHGRSSTPPYPDIPFLLIQALLSHMYSFTLSFHLLWPSSSISTCNFLFKTLWTLSSTSSQYGHTILVYSFSTFPPLPNLHHLHRCSYNTPHILSLLIPHAPLRSLISAHLIVMAYSMFRSLIHISM